MAIQLPLSEPEGGPSSSRGVSSGRYDLAYSLSGHSRAVTALQFSSDGSILVSAGADGRVNIWDAVNGTHKGSFRAHKLGINDISISPDSLYVATASDDHTIAIYTLSPLPSSSTTTQHPLLRQLRAHTAPVLSVAFSPTSGLLVSGSIDESAIIWDVRGGKVLRSLPAHSDMVWCVGWDAEGGMVITSSADGLIRLWDASTGQCLKTLDNDTNSPVSYASFTPSSTYLLSSTLSSTIRIYNIHTAKVLKTLLAPGQFISEKFPCPALMYPAPAAISADNASTNGTNGGEHAPARRSRKRMQDAWVVSGSENGKAVIWDLSSRTVVQILETESKNSPIIAVAVSPDGKIVVTGSLEPDKLINVWHIQ